MNELRAISQIGQSAPICGREPKLPSILNRQEKLCAKALENAHTLRSRLVCVMSPVARGVENQKPQDPCYPALIAAIECNNDKLKELNSILGEILDGLEI